MKNLTLVLLTCGELSEQEAIAAVQPYRDRIEWIEIRNVYPQIKALNLMVDSVQTEFFVPLDADIVLYPEAVDRLQSAINRYGHDPQWHSILFPLYDRLTEKKILALKLFRSKIIKDHPFAETATPDVEHYARLTDAGYTCIGDFLPLRPIGVHVVAGKRFCYNKYKDVYLTLRTHDREWDPGVFLGGETVRERAKNHFDFFFLKWAKTDNPDYLHCIAGMVDGLTSEVDRKSKSLDPSIGYRIKDEDAPGLFMDWYLNESPYQCSGAMLF